MSHAYADSFFQDCPDQNIDAMWAAYADSCRIEELESENAKLRKENDTLCHRIDEVCMENEQLRNQHNAKRIVVSNHNTDCATGHTECSECRGTVNPCARFCEHCGALFKEGE